MRKAELDWSPRTERKVERFKSRGTEIKQGLVGTDENSGLLFGRGGGGGERWRAQGRHDLNMMFLLESLCCISSQNRLEELKKETNGANAIF